MSAISNPTPGSIVYFHEEGGPYPAIVTAVNPDGTMELATFGKNSLYFQHNVPERKTRDSERGTWSWPPRT